MSRTRSGRKATASRTACGPSARNSPVRERTERRDSARTALTRSDRGLVSTGVSRRSRCWCDVGRRRSGGVAGDLRLGCVDSGRDVGAGELHERGEGRGVVDGEVREDLAVDLDTGGLEALHEPVVRHAVGAGRSVDALDPEATEVTLLRATVTVGVTQRVGDLLLGLAVEARPLTAVAAGALENDSTLLLGVDRPLHACHVNTPSLLDAVLAAAGLPETRLLSESLMGGGPGSLAEELLGLLGVRLGELDVVRDGTHLLARLVLEQVATAGLLAHDLAGAGEAETLLRTAVRLHLRHGGRSPSCCVRQWAHVVCRAGGSRLRRVTARRSLGGGGGLVGLRGLGLRLLAGRCRLAGGALVVLLAGATLLGLGLRLLLGRADHHDHVSAVLLRGRLDEAELGDVLGEALQQAATELGPRLLATAEHDRHLDLVTGLEEPLDVATLGAVVVRVDLRTELDLLDDGVDLVLARFPCLHGGFVLEIAEVHELGERRLGHGGHLDEVEVRLLSQTERVLDAHDADLLAVGSNQAHFRDPDALVDARLADVVLLSSMKGVTCGVMLSC